MGPPLIQLVDIHKSYESAGGTVHAIRGVTLTIDRGDFVAIMGPSGSGKSTLMHVIGCLDRATHGRYLFNGIDVSSLDRNALADIRNAKLGFVFQSFNLLSRSTALENVQLPLLCSRRRTSAEAIRLRAIKCLADVGLESRHLHFPAQLSGGQQQRVAIARALVNEPDLIVADEPTGNLDSDTAMGIMRILQQLNRSGITIVMVTHEPDIARECKSTLSMRDGQMAHNVSFESNLLHSIPVPARLIYSPSTQE